MAISSAILVIVSVWEISLSRRPRFIKGIGEQDVQNLL